MSGFIAEIRIIRNKGERNSIRATVANKTVSNCFCRICSPEYTNIFQEAPVRRKRFIMVFILNPKGKYFSPNFCTTSLYSKKLYPPYASTCFIPKEWKGKRFNVVYITKGVENA